MQFIQLLLYSIKQANFPLKIGLRVIVVHQLKHVLQFSVKFQLLTIEAQVR